MPAFFTPNYDEYVRSVCFVQNTYYVNHTDKIPRSFSEKKTNEILYYQWIPFLLLIKAFLFYIPRMSWNAFGLKSGVQVSDLVESSFAYKLPTTDPIYRRMCLNYVVDTIDEYCSEHRRHIDSWKHLKKFQRNLATVWCLAGRNLGNYLVILYTATKLMYLSISLLQIFLLSLLLGSNFAAYGVRVIVRLFQG